jgi:anti-sigma regulatory factor (Ser/Thr protein kinase)
MNDNVLFKKAFTIKPSDFASAGEASVEVKNILKEVGFDPDVIRRVAIASYEAEMNVVMYGEGGEMTCIVKPGIICIRVEDKGPGIPDIDQAMREGYSTATDEMREMGFGAGMGLPNIKKNSDELTIKSDRENGTCVEMIIKRRRGEDTDG